MVLIDQNKSTGWSHMVASTVSELHEFAERIGCKRFDNKKGKNRPHYDLKQEEHNAAIELGALSVSSKAIVVFLKIHYNSGLSKEQIKKMVLFWETLRYSTEGKVESFTSETRESEISKITSDIEEKHIKHLEFGEEIAEYLAMMELFLNIFK